MISFSPRVSNSERETQTNMSQTVARDVVIKSLVLSTTRNYSVYCHRGGSTPDIIHILETGIRSFGRCFFRNYVISFPVSSQISEVIIVEGLCLRVYYST